MSESERERDREGEGERARERECEREQAALPVLESSRIPLFELRSRCSKAFWASRCANATNHDASAEIRSQPSETRLSLVLLGSN